MVTHFGSLDCYFTSIYGSYFCENYMQLLIDLFTNTLVKFQ